MLTGLLAALATGVYFLSLVLERKQDRTQTQRTEAELMQFNNFLCLLTQCFGLNQKMDIQCLKGWRDGQWTKPGYSSPNRQRQNVTR